MPTPRVPTLQWTQTVRLTLSDIDFSFEKTFECGQCFRWNRIPASAENPIFACYLGVVGRSVLVVSRAPLRSAADADAGKKARTDAVAGTGEVEIRVFGAPLSDEDIAHYFDLAFDYGRYADEASAHDSVLAQAIRYGRGMRLLKQDAFETTISFILSANNNIPKIKRSVESLCRIYGEPLGKLPRTAFRGLPVVAGDLLKRTWYGFPTAEAIAAEPERTAEVEAIGYRARYVAATCARIATEKHWYSGLKALEDAPLTEALMELSGVGKKVADCISLFGYGRLSAFPVDTWVKRLFAELYGVTKGYDALIQERFPVAPGLSQQLLFYYMRGIAGKSSAHPL